jgi:hypothetical protein
LAIIVLQKALKKIWKSRGYHFPETGLIGKNTKFLAMKRMNWSVLVLFSGLFLVSCGDGGQEGSEVEDTTNMEMTTPPPVESTSPMPDTVNGIDTTVKVDGTEPDAQLGK